jgi:hypothetical protein
MLNNINMRSLFCRFRFENYRPRKTRQYFRITLYFKYMKKVFPEFNVGTVLTFFVNAMLIYYLFPNTSITLYELTHI